MRLENNLLHQLNAVNAVCGVFAGVDFAPSTDKNKCKRINLSDSTIKRNIQAVQNGDYYADDYKLPDYYRKNYTDSDYLNIDVKMETGTGKTYVYTRTMFELHKHYGINKFILLVPTVPIKEGVKAFLKSSYMKTDSQALYNGMEMYLHVLDTQKKVKGRKMFPTPIVEFANGTDIGGNRIDVLLINSGMLTSGETMGASYDQTLLGNYTQPYETLREIAPFVIIDEPHKFARSQKTFKCLIDNIKPQCVIRYGATFPEVSKGKFDYENVVYNLGSCDAFNNNLIKGVEVEYIAEESKLKDQVKVKVLSISANKGETKIARTKKVDVDGSVDFEEVVGSSFTEKKELTYSTFLKETQAKTNIPIKLMHAALCEYFTGKTVPEKYFCKQTLQKFVDEYRLWFISQFNERHSYEKVDVAVNDPLCDADGKLKKSIVRTDVGQIPADIAVLDKYLYDACCYDSQLERENITTDITSSIAEIEVFGKIPKRTVRIPTYADGTYSPDFMYIVKKKDGSKQLNLVVETKDKTELDTEENRKIDCAKKLFEEMQREVDNVRFRKQLRGEEMVKIIEELF